VTPIEAVVFDLDGVLIDSEATWSTAREAVTTETGGRWHERAQADMMGMSSTEWSRYMHEELAVPLPPEKISEQVVERLEQLFREHLPLVAGATSVIEQLGGRWPLAIASSSNRPLINLVLGLSGLASYFDASVSSEEVTSGKPAADVYLAAAKRIGVDARFCVAVEDSTNGLRSASAAGMWVIAVPNRDFPPDEDSVALAHTVLWSLRQLVPPVVEALGSATTAAPGRGTMPRLARGPTTATRAS
jgi:HAD superfamily hydrolase (TIGR01509 family)